MQRQAAYPPSYTTTQSSHLPRYSSSHCTSSAFSASAQPNEDWTKISDLAERRRIQNRIAQRNHRKKIKRRLEDLEKRASTSPSPEQTFSELTSARAPTKRSTGSRRQSIKREAFQPPSRKAPPEPLVTPYSSIGDSRPRMSPGHFKREISTSPSAHLEYPYPMADPASPSTYPPQAAYHTLPQPFSDYPDQSPYLPSVSTTLPAMSNFEPSHPKPPHYFDEGNITNQYGINYGAFTSMELPMQQQFPEPNLHTPPLSHSRSFDRSRDGSPPMFPLTPTSNPGSPRLTFR